MRYAALILLAAAAAAPNAASAQSMNIPLIVQRVTTDICGPLMRTGDMEAALRSAVAQGYLPVDWSKTGDFDPADPPSRVVLDGSARHIGTLTLAGGRRGLCAIDMAEAGAAQIVEAMADHAPGLGLTLVHDAGDHRPAAAVWTGEGRLAVAAPGPNSPGHALSFSWTLPPAR